MKLKNLTKKLKNKNLIDFVIILLIYAFLFTYFDPKLLLMRTTTSGGDMGSDNYLAKYMRDYLLPKGKIFGWSPERWAGYPIFQFIFPLPYVIIALLSYIIPLEIAFKLITVSGVFLLPLFTYLSFKLMKFDFPTPIIASIFTLFFLFQEKNTVFGGNIPSVLAGEFSYSISFSLMVLFMGLFYNRISHKKFSVLPSILFSLVFLSHSVTSIIAGLSSIFFLLTKNKKEFLYRLKYLFLTFFISFLLVSFWALPLLAKLEYTSKYGRDWPINLSAWYPKEAVFFHILAVFGIFYAIKNKDEKIFYFLFVILVSIIGFLNGEVFMTANIRFWPMLYFFVLMIAASFVGWLISKFKFKVFLVFVVFGISLLWIKNSVSFTGYWIKWNYEGFESKTTWPILEGIINLLRGTPGRAYNDLSDENDKLGTPRVFESLPYFADKPTLEGVYAQSTISVPFISYTQCEISHHCAGIPTVGGVERTTTYNLKDGTKHLKILNVKQLIAIYDRLKEDLKNDRNWKLIGKFDEWEVYELLTHDGKYVTVPEYKPNMIKVHGDEWKVLSLDWWVDLNNTDVPVVFTKDVGFYELDNFIEISGLSELKREKINNTCNIVESLDNEEIIFKTSCVGKPHIISMSYYPNWRVEGAKKAYMVSPAFMLVIPEKEEVRLKFVPMPIDIIGSILSFLGLILIVYLKFFKEF